MEQTSSKPPLDSPSPFWNAVRWMVFFAAIGTLAFAVLTAIGGLEFDFPAFDDEARAALMVFGLPALVGVPVVIFLWAEAVHHVRATRGRRIVAYLESAVRLDAPLPEMIRAMATNEKPSVSGRMNTLAASLSVGEPLAASLRRHVPEVSPRQIELIGVAERTGRLRQTLADLILADTRAMQGARRWIEWLYPMVIAYILALMLAGLMVFIAPKFQEIFADFDLPLPAASLLLVQRENLPVATGLLIVLGSIAVLTTLWTLMRIATLPRSSRSSARQAVSEVLLSVPFIGAVTRDRQLADVCYSVGSSVRASLPLPSALMEAGSLELSPKLRQRIMCWAVSVRSGQPTDHAARDAGLPNVLVGMLATGQAAASPAEAFDFLHRYYAGRFSRAVELMRGALVPLTVLVMGVAIGWVVLAAFMPLAALIKDAATSWGS